MTNDKPLVQCIHVRYCDNYNCEHYYPHERNMKDLGCGRTRNCPEGRAISCWAIRDDGKLKKYKHELELATEEQRRLIKLLQTKKSLIREIQATIDQEERGLGIYQREKCPKNCNDCEFMDCEPNLCIGTHENGHNCNICSAKVCKLHNI